MASCPKCNRRKIRKRPDGTKKCLRCGFLPGYEPEYMKEKTMNQQIKVLKANGTYYILNRIPTLEEMQKIVGGYIEHVRVLDRIEGGRFIYTSLYVNEEGLLNDLPRNKAATEIYQRNARAQHPSASQPFKKMEEEFTKQFEGANIIKAPEPVPGYSNDPYVAGDAIFFEGYTCEEADLALDSAASA